MTAAQRRASTVRAARRLTHLTRDESDCQRVVAAECGVGVMTVVTPVTLSADVAEKLSDEALESRLCEEPTDLVYVVPHPLRHDKPKSLAEAIRDYDLSRAAIWGSMA